MNVTITPSICLGIDPGSIACGWAVVSRLQATMKLIDAGIISLTRGADFDKRILTIHFKLIEVINQYNPHSMAIESPFVEKNAATAIKLGQIRGGILLTAGLSGMPVGSYNPMQVKKAVSGYGWADKIQVSKMVMIILNLQKPLKADASDAAAVAISHLLTTRK
jgi:crossover junction endodeoxyribonuclease RuvC